MNDPNKSLDESIEKILTWRATRAAPVGLLEQITAGIEADARTRGRSRGFFGGSGKMGRLALLGVTLAALLAAAVGAWASAGSKPEVVPSASTSTPQASAASLLKLVFCDQVRTVPFDAAKIDLTGTWTDRSDLYYLRQEGNVVWGVSVHAIAQRPTFDPSSAFFTTLHGTIGSGLTLHLDRGEVGVVNSTDTRTPPLANGTIDFRIERGSNGNVQLTTTAQTGADQIAGPAGSNPVLSPCTPTEQ